MKTASGVALATAMFCTVALAGDLNPPAGPIAPTPGPEPRTPISIANTPGDADSIYKITAPGSYYLTANITGVSGKHGIEIASSDVTVDLMGFELRGVAGSLDGVTCSVLIEANIEVRNGTAQSWGAFGVNLGTASTRNCRVDHVRAEANGQAGVWIGVDSAVEDCIAESNSAGGILADSGSTVRRCSASQGDLNAFSIGSTCQVSDCIAISNDGRGFSIGSGSTVTRCTAFNNTGDGIFVGLGCTVTECTCEGNDSDGIRANSGSCTISTCTVTNSGLDGIRVGPNCLVTGNTCASAGLDPATGAGIHVISSDSRIEGNNCLDSDRGIDVDVAGNLIVRNSCSGNTTNWDIVANNVYGPIIDRTSPASAAVTGNSAGSTLGSTDANANYSY